MFFNWFIARIFDVYSLVTFNISCGFFFFFQSADLSFEFLLPAFLFVRLQRTTTTTISLIHPLTVTQVTQNRHRVKTYFCLKLHALRYLTTPPASNKARAVVFPSAKTPTGIPPIKPAVWKVPSLSNRRGSPGGDEHAARTRCTHPRRRSWQEKDKSTCPNSH